MTSSPPRTVCYDWAKTFSLHPRRGREHPRPTAEPVVIDYETFSKIHDCHDRQGLTIAQTARALGLHPRTVATWVARSRFEPRRSQPRSSVLDPFKPRIIRLLDTHPYSAQQIFQRLREEGYGGGMTILRDYVRRIRPTKRPVYLKLHFAPGECAQVDWGAYGTVAVGNTRRRLSFFVMVLAFSRQMFVEFTVSQTHGAFPRLPRTRLRRLGCAVQNHGRQSQIRGSAAPGRRCAGVQPALSRLCPPPRLRDRGLQCRPRQREGARGVRCGLRQKEFPAWARVDRLQHDPRGRTGLARHHRQRAHPWRNATATRRFVCARASASGNAQPEPLRPCTYFDQYRLQPVPHYPGYQPVFRPRRIRSPPIDGQSLSRPGLHLLRQPAHRPSHALLWSA